MLSRTAREARRGAGYMVCTLVCGMCVPEWGDDMQQLGFGRHMGGRIGSGPDPSNDLFTPIVAHRSRWVFHPEEGFAYRWMLVY